MLVFIVDLVLSLIAITGGGQKTLIKHINPGVNGDNKRQTEVNKQQKRFNNNNKLFITFLIFLVYSFPQRPVFIIIQLIDTYLHNTIWSMSLYERCSNGYACNLQ